METGVARLKQHLTAARRPR